MAPCLLSWLENCLNPLMEMDHLSCSSFEHLRREGVRKAACRAPCSSLPLLCQGEAGVGVEQGGRLPTALSWSPGDLVYLPSYKQAGALLSQAQSLLTWSSPSIGLWAPDTRRVTGCWGRRLCYCLAGCVADHLAGKPCPTPFCNLRSLL